MNVRLSFIKKLNHFKYFIFIVFFVGCGSKTTLRKKNISDISQLQEMVDRITSIPDTPFGFVVLSVHRDLTQEGNIEILYKPVKSNKQSFEQISDVVSRAYEMNMETLGWDLMHQMRMPDSWLLLFNRPGKTLCQISFNIDRIITIILLRADYDKKGL